MRGCATFAVGGFPVVCYHLRPMRPALLPLILFLSVFALGCEPTPAAQARVHGTVTVNGRPLRGGTIVFVPDRQRGNRGDVAQAVVGEDGRFELRGKHGMGAVPGWHRITVAPPPDATDLVQRMEKYRYPDQSGLSREIKAGSDNQCDIQIELEQ